MAGDPNRDRINEVLADTWRDSQETLLERVGSLDVAVAGLKVGELDPRVAETAQTDVHKLAGVLGMFGLSRGSELARTAEQRLDEGAIPSDAAELGEIATELRAMIEDVGTTLPPRDQG